MTIAESKQALVEDFLRKAKEIEYLIDSLPLDTEGAAAAAAAGANESNANTQKAREGKVGLSNTEEVAGGENDDDEGTPTAQVRKSDLVGHWRNEDDDRELQELESELKLVNAQYMQVLSQTRDVHGELKATIRGMLEEHTVQSRSLIDVELGFDSAAAAAG